MRGQSPHREGGFTLVELLIVVVVLGVLAAAVISNYIDFTGESRTSVCKQDGRIIVEAIEAYKAREDAVPTTQTDLVNAGYVTKVSEYWQEDIDPSVDKEASAPAGC